MKDLRRARRTGAAAIVCALMMRLWSAGVPQALVSWIFQQNIASFLTDSETGQNVYSFIYYSGDSWISTLYHRINFCNLSLTLLFLV